MCPLADSFDIKSLRCAPHWLAWTKTDQSWLRRLACIRRHYDTSWKQCVAPHVAPHVFMFACTISLPPREPRLCVARAGPWRTTLWVLHQFVFTRAWVNGSQIWNTLKPWEPPPEPSCCPANTVHCWKSSMACRTSSNPAFKAPFKWKKSSTASRIRGKLFLAKRKLTGHLESPYKDGSSLLPTVPPCMKPLKTCRDPIPKAAKKTQDKPFGTHLLELLFGAQEFSPSTFLAPKNVTTFYGVAKAAYKNEPFLHT